MPIVIEAKYRYSGVVTPPGLNEETAVIELLPQANDYIVEGYLDLSSMEDGDTVVVREYIGVGNGSLKLFMSNTYVDRQSEPIIRLHTKTLLYNMRYRVTVTQTSGTLRSIPYAFIVEVMCEV